MSTHPATYDSDLYTWSLEQADLLRQGKFDQLDLEHIIEEIIVHAHLNLRCSLL